MKARTELGFWIRGLRFKELPMCYSGDPSSPLLFILAIEVSFKNVVESRTLWNIERHSSGKRSLKISHLMFTDDLIIFAWVKKVDLFYISHCLDQFVLYALTIIQIQLSKSSIFFSFFSRNVNCIYWAHLNALASFKQS